MLLFLQPPFVTGNTAFYWADNKYWYFNPIWPRVSFWWCVCR